MLRKENRLIRAEVRLHYLKNNGKNIDSPGVVRKLERKIRRLRMERGED